MPCFEMASVLVLMRGWQRKDSECAGKAAKQKEAFIEAQKPVVVQKMGEEKRPDWTWEKPYFEDCSGYLFVRQKRRKIG
jgi:hypothetical protein